MLCLINSFFSLAAWAARFFSSTSCYRLSFSALSRKDLPNSLNKMKSSFGLASLSCPKSSFSSRTSLIIRSYPAWPISSLILSSLRNEPNFSVKTSNRSTFSSVNSRYWMHESSPDSSWSKNYISTCLATNNFFSASAHSASKIGSLTLNSCS